MEQIATKKYILTDDGEVIYCKDNRVMFISEINKYAMARHTDGLGTNVHFFDSIVKENHSLHDIQQEALQYYENNPNRKEEFVKVLGGTGMKNPDLKLLMRNRIIEYMEDYD